MASDTPNIDISVILSLAEAALKAIAGLAVEYLGSAPSQAGDSTAITVRVRDAEVQYPSRRRDGISGDEARVVMTLSLAAPSNAESGGLLLMARNVNAVKLAFDRQDLYDATSLTLWRPEAVSASVRDVSDASGGDNGDHGALAGEVRIEGYAQKTSGLDLIGPS